MLAANKHLIVAVMLESQPHRCEMVCNRSEYKGRKENGRKTWKENLLTLYNKHTGSNHFLKLNSR